MVQFRSLPTIESLKKKIWIFNSQHAYRGDYPNLFLSLAMWPKPTWEAHWRIWRNLVWRAKERFDSCSFVLMEFFFFIGHTALARTISPWMKHFVLIQLIVSIELILRLSSVRSSWGSMCSSTILPNWVGLLMVMASITFCCITNPIGHTLLSSLHLLCPHFRLLCNVYRWLALRARLFHGVLTTRKSPKVYCSRMYFRKLNSHSFYLKKVNIF